jgi:DNA-dependent protein kinase catalytic subunit
VELATTSGSRRPKVAACELLHALVLYMVGREAQVLGRRNVVKEAMDSLYKRVFPAVMQLACDVELVNTVFDDM